MSIQEKKNALFNKSSSNKPINTEINQNQTKSSTITNNTIKKTLPIPSTTLAPAIKAKKLEEAKDLSKRGVKHLEKTVFKWNPDYLAAAPLFESPADIYKQLEEYDISINTYIKSAECNEAINALASAALTVMKAAAVAQLKKDNKLSSGLFEKSAELWALHGDIDRSAEILSKAANELDEEDPIAAIELYKRACDMICPPDTPKSNLSKIHPKAIEIFGLYFKCLLKYTTNTLVNSKDQSIYFEKLLALANRLVVIYEAYESESSMCKMLLTITVLQLTMGDTVLADKTYIQDHLSNSVYLRSKESELAEELIQSFKAFDIDRLDKTLRLPQINYLDREIQSLIRRLSLFKSKDSASSTNDYISSADSLTNDLANLLLSTGVDVSTNVKQAESQTDKPVETNINIDNIEVNEFADVENNINNDDEDEIDLS